MTGKASQRSKVESPKAAVFSEDVNPYLSPGSVDYIFHTFSLETKLEYLSSN